MNQKKTGNRRLRNRADKFQPNRAYIEKAVREYLKKGGKITRVEIMPDFVDSGDTYADEYLMGWV